MAWNNSARRRHRLGPDGTNQAALVRQVHLRDGGVCYVCRRHGADQVDHVIPLFEGGRNTLENMRAIHSSPCHATKSRAEAARAHPTTTRRLETHPGAL